MKSLVTTLLLATALAAAEPPKDSPLRIEEPFDRTIYQRDERGSASIPVCCQLADAKGVSVEVRALDRQTQKSASQWTKLSAEAKEGSFRTRLALSAGWYQLEFRASRAGAVVATGTLEHVGVGEVFVTCGQSNSANHGGPKQTAKEDRVSTCHFETGLWAHADDPQPGATGKGGSPWPLLGDLLVKKLDMPVGFICVGVGATPVSFWTPAGKGYPRVKAALQRAGPRGVRAVLWHQGESDSIAGTSAEKYAKMLGEAIAQSRKDAGWPVPWGVALASFHPAKEATAERQAAIVAGQKKVIAEAGGVFAGPETDSFHTKGWLSDSVHFNAEGLAAHAQGWADVLLPLLPKAGSTPAARNAK